MEEPEYLTTEDIARILRVHEKTVRELIHNGELPAIRVGKRPMRVLKSDFEEYQKRQRIPPREKEE